MSSNPGSKAGNNAANKAKNSRPKDTAPRKQLTTHNRMPTALRNPKGRNSYKRRGEIAEMEFMVQVGHKGWGISSPYGDTERYDFIVDTDKKLWRVQVKSGSSTHWRAYTVNPCWKSARKHLAYRPSQIDFLAVLILEHDIWYLIPVRALHGRLMISLYPFGSDRKNSLRLEKYREAWPLLHPKKRPRPRYSPRPCATDTPVRRL
jgi:hypothetical protein